MTMRTVLLAGGVGGAKMAEGFVATVGPDDLSIIGNVADDAEFHGLWVSPDIDTVTYTLADLIDRERGWGIGGDTFTALGVLGQLGDDCLVRFVCRPAAGQDLPYLVNLEAGLAGKDITDRSDGHILSDRNVPHQDPDIDGSRPAHHSWMIDGHEQPVVQRRFVQPRRLMTVAVRSDRQ